VLRLHLHSDPHIDRPAGSGERFTQAFTPVPITLPAHTSLLTGMFPLATGVHDFMGNRLPPGTATLARILHDHGYSTAAFIGAPVLDSRFGLNQGFDVFQACRPGRSVPGYHEAPWRPSGG
jgi:arylsulfatase A-like enzyme